MPVTKCRVARQLTGRKRKRPPTEAASQLSSAPKELESLDYVGASFRGLLLKIEDGLPSGTISVVLSLVKAVKHLDCCSLRWVAVDCREPAAASYKCPPGCLICFSDLGQELPEGRFV